MISDAFTINYKTQICSVDMDILRKNWNDRCAVLKFGNTYNPDEVPPTYAVQENFGVDNYSHRNVSVEDALAIIKMLDLKEITPPWDDGNPNRARKYVSRNSSDNWSR